MGIFVACSALYVLIPALAIPTPAIIATVVVGWEAMLSAFSYWLDAGRGPAPSRRDSLFFIIVNPCLVYPERGEKIGRLSLFSRQALPRVGLGVVAWISHTMVAQSLPILSQRASSTERVILWAVGSAVALYFAHSGLASLQIGFARVIGHEIPERYTYPFLARSPEDFWRRWNRYLGGWIRRYVFVPAALGLGSPRISRRLPARAAAFLALILSFLAVGLLHQYVFWVQTYAVKHVFEPSLSVTGMFIAFGLIALAWRMSSRIAKQLGVSRLFKVSVVQPAVAGVRRLALFAVALGMTWMFMMCTAG